MRTAARFAAAAGFALLMPGPARALDGVIGVYADLTATQTSATFSIGVPRTLFIVAQLEGQSASGMTGAEFRVDGLPPDWLVLVSPNPAAVISLGDAFHVVDGVQRANIAFPSCTLGTEGRVLLYTAVVVANSVVESGDLVVQAGDPPANPNWPVPLLTVCDYPEYSKVAVQGDAFHIGTRAPQDLDYSRFPGYDGVRGVQPERGLPGDVFHFRVFYSSADGLPPAAGSPRVELDANGDGDALDPNEGIYTMLPADLDSTLLNGKEYRFDLALGEPPGGNYRYRFTALDSRGAPVPGPATAWRDSLMVSNGLAELAVYADEIRTVPQSPETGAVCSIAAVIHNESDRRVDGVTVHVEDVHGNPIAERMLATLGPRSATEVACAWTFTTVGFQPVIVRVDPENAIVEGNESNNVATHGVYSGGAAISGNLDVSGLPGLVTVPPAAPFVLQGHASYPGGTVPSLAARGARVVAVPTWEAAQTTRTDADGNFSASFVPPPAPGIYRIDFSVSDGVATRAVSVDVEVAPLGDALPPHGPNLAVQLAAALDPGCPAASATLSGSVANRGDLASEPTTVRILVGGTSTVAEVAIGAISPGASATLDPVTAPLAGPGPYAFTAHVDPGSLQRELREDDNYAVAGVRVPADCLDLALEKVAFTSAAFCSSTAISMTVRVANRGCLASQPARVAWRAGGTEIASAPLAALAPGETAVLSYSNVFGLDCHSLDFVLDPEGAAGTDCDPGSNTLSAGLCTVDCPPPPPPPPPPRPDFSVLACDIRASNSKPAAGEPLHFEAWIQNVGPGDATAPVFVRFAVDSVPVGDPVSVGPLAAGARTQVASVAAWPADFRPHVLAVVIDPNGQEEVSAANNQAGRGLPYDLRAAPIGRCPPSVPSMFSTCSPCLGIPLQIRAVAVNYGLFDCDSVRVDFRDDAHGGTVIGSAVALDVLAGGSCSGFPDPVAVSYAFLTMGAQTITAVVDPANDWPESDDTNNSYTGEVSVPCAAAPDLVASVRVPGPTPVPGDTVRAVEVTVTNRGSWAAVAVQARLKLDGVPLCDLAMGDLAPGGSNTSVCTAPWLVTGGCSQILEACADPYNTISESNEANNCASTGVGSGATDLAIYPYTIRITPTNPLAGEQVLIEVGLYSLRGVESNCLLTVDWGLDGTNWTSIGVVLLHLPGGVEIFPYLASFVWTVPSPNLRLRFQLLQVCPVDLDLSNNVAYGTLPWFTTPNTPVVVSDLEAQPTPDGVAIRWRAEPLVTAFLIERRTAGEADWERLPETIPVASGTGAAAYEYLDRTAPAGSRLEYRILGRMPDGSEQPLGTVSVAFDAAGLGPAQLHAVRPNPFRPGGAFEFTLPDARSVELCVYNAAGRRIATLRSGPEGLGRHSVVWDGRDETGRQVPAGVYFCRFVAGSFQQARRFVLVH